MTEPRFCVCDPRHDLVCAWHSTPEHVHTLLTRYSRPLTGTELLAVLVMWVGLFGVVVVSVRLFGW